ncbi:hypothetical protein MUP01_04340, partial [Candidatus Bathyarchaeota archaeon]|nr:hypothetical protein [Candidatus Bathyarchaeota archaeon]
MVANGKEEEFVIKKKDLVIVVVVAFCLTAALFAILPVSSSGAWPYNPWWDINDDGKIDVKDVASVARAFGSTGQNISKAGLLYDSGWINVTWGIGENYTVTHGLNMSCTNLIVDARGRTQGWNRTYGGTGWDYASALIQTSDGGYALAGYTNSSGAGNGDFWLVKTDASGNEQWSKTYGGTNWDYANALVQTTDGGYALAGVTYSFGAGNGDFWLVKTDASGNEQWNKSYGGTNWDYANALVQTSDGGYTLAGRTASFTGSPSNFDFWLVKTDASGNEQWSKTYGGWLFEAVLALVQTTDGGYALAGETSSFGAGNGDFWLVKTDASGNEQWNKSYGGTNYDQPCALVQTGDGGYALAGGTDSFGAGSRDFWLVKTDSVGNAQWNRTYGGTDYDCAC